MFFHFIFISLAISFAALFIYNCVVFHRCIFFFHIIFPIPHGLLFFSFSLPLFFVLLLKRSKSVKIIYPLLWFTFPLPLSQHSCNFPYFVLLSSSSPCLSIPDLVFFKFWLKFSLGIVRFSILYNYLFCLYIKKETFLLDRISLRASLSFFCQFVLYSCVFFAKCGVLIYSIQLPMLMCGQQKANETLFYQLLYFVKIWFDLFGLDVFFLFCLPSLFRSTPTIARPAYALFIIFFKILNVFFFIWKNRLSLLCFAIYCFVLYSYVFCYDLQ